MRSLPTRFWRCSPRVPACQGFAPTITGQPRSQYVFSGSPAQLSATGINGTTPFAYQWQLNGTNIQSLADSANFSGINSNILTILSVTANDVGSYQLIVTNLYGTAVQQQCDPYHSVYGIGG